MEEEPAVADGAERPGNAEAEAWSKEGTTLLFLELNHEKPPIAKGSHE